MCLLQCLNCNASAFLMGLIQIQYPNWLEFLFAKIRHLAFKRLNFGLARLGSCGEQKEEDGGCVGRERSAAELVVLWNGVQSCVSCVAIFPNLDPGSFERTYQRSQRPWGRPQLKRFPRWPPGHRPVQTRPGSDPKIRRFSPSKSTYYVPVSQPSSATAQRPVVVLLYSVCSDSSEWWRNGEKKKEPAAEKRFPDSKNLEICDFRPRITPNKWGWKCVKVYEEDILFSDWEIFLPIEANINGGK